MREERIFRKRRGDIGKLNMLDTSTKNIDEIWGRLSVWLTKKKLTHRPLDFFFFEQTRQMNIKLKRKLCNLNPRTCLSYIRSFYVYHCYDLVILVLNKRFYFCGHDHLFNYTYFYVHDHLQVYFLLGNFDLG
jgi:hypothetical protein